MKILLPIDGSELSVDAVRHALTLVRSGLAAEFVLANVQEPAHLYEMLMTRDTAVVEAASLAAGEHALEPAERLLRDAGCSYEREIVIGNPAHALVDIAEDYGCDAIVMGTRGKGVLPGTRIGSVAQAVLDDATVAVTFVKHADAEPPADDGEAGAEEPSEP